MDQQQQQQQHYNAGDDWELVAANEVHVIDALKQEGNALFQKHQLHDAIQVYARALAQLPPPHTLRQFTTEDTTALVNLEIAVRLNRALAYIELQDDKLLRYAEEDCSLALTKQPGCVKAHYRRALARERLGLIKEALLDAERMHELEPANPAAHQLLTRLQEAWSNQTPQKPVDTESSLTTALQQQCAISKASTQTTSATAAEASAALAAWQALQDEELRLRDAIKHTGVATKTTATVVKSKTKRVVKKGDLLEIRPCVGGEVSAKTESLWASLAQEEASTVAQVYKKNKKQTTIATGKLKTASIRPSRR